MNDHERRYQLRKASTDRAKAIQRAEDDYALEVHRIEAHYSKSLRLKDWDDPT